MNLTRTVTKAPINGRFDHVAAAQLDTGSRVAPKYDEPGIHDLSDAELAQPITAAHFKETLDM